MSEYIEIESELDEEDPAVIHLYTNLPLTTAASGVEEYDSYDEMMEGSPLAQALAVINGIAQLRLDGTDMMVVRDIETPEHALIADISAALKDFFL